jgi:hypothetical protein|tara:strand:- start:1361 stop:1555 length:195 start_codon:yes stop_codon:yes gene_type:complete
MTVLSREFWSFSSERAIKTFAQAAIATLGGGSIGLLDVDWAGVASVSAGAAVLSILTSIVTKSK